MALPALRSAKQSAKREVRLWVRSSGSDCRKRGAKLTAADVAAIHADSRLRSEIAKSYGVNWSTIDNIKSGRSWGGVNGKISKRMAGEVR